MTFQKGNRFGSRGGRVNGYQRMDTTIQKELARDPNARVDPPINGHELLARIIIQQAFAGKEKQQETVIRANDGLPVKRVEQDLVVKRYAWGDGKDPLGLDHPEDQLRLAEGAEDE